MMMTDNAFIALPDVYGSSIGTWALYPKYLLFGKKIWNVIDSDVPADSLQCGADELNFMGSRVALWNVMFYKDVNVYGGVLQYVEVYLSGGGTAKEVRFVGSTITGASQQSLFTSYSPGALYFDAVRIVSEGNHTFYLRGV
ncbi:TPA: hypothetical protein EYP13_00065, partial [Candidatus Micrarchaeota archaeon]|nr:hypothetical protein [Candidatus Micrarchaeota archaeon]